MDNAPTVGSVGTTIIIAASPAHSVLVRESWSSPVAPVRQSSVVLFSPTSDFRLQLNHFSRGFSQFLEFLNYFYSPFSFLSAFCHFSMFLLNGQFLSTSFLAIFICAFCAIFARRFLYFFIIFTIFHVFLTYFCSTFSLFLRFLPIFHLFEFLKTFFTSFSAFLRAF